MNDEKIIQIEEMLQAAGVPSSSVSEVMELLKASQSPVAARSDVQEGIDELWLKMQDETDWRRRCALAAAIISRRLDY